jgi:hypothetical protein
VNWREPGILGRTSGQLGIWRHQHLHPGSSIYNVGEYLEIRGDLDLVVFEAALRRVIGEVDAFHLRFCDDEAGPQQYVDKSGDWPLWVIDFSAEADPRVAAEGWMRTSMRRPFDLGNGPIFTEAVLKVGPGVFFWYQIAHHIAYDAFSAAVIAARVARAYTMLLAAEPAAGDSLGPISALFESHHSYAASAEFERDREFWLDVLAGFPGAASVSGRQGQSPSQVARRHLESVVRADMAGLRPPGVSRPASASSWSLPRRFTCTALPARRTLSSVSPLPGEWGSGGAIPRAWRVISCPSVLP